MSAAFLFPGQGSEIPGMGAAAITREGITRRLLLRASEATKVDLAAFVLRGDPKLSRTEFGQPALVSISLGLALEHRAAGNEPSAAAGHSVGEVAAFSVAGCLEPEEAVDCVVERARLMSEAARASPGGMAALRVGDEASVNQALTLGQLSGRLSLAAHNAPEEWVLTGDKPALAAVAAKFPTVALPVSGPWHSAAMATAAESWRASLRHIGWRRPSVPLVANASGRFVTASDDLAELLAGQLTAPVRWAETMQTLRSAGITAFHIFGPGRVLRGLCRSNVGADVTAQLHTGEEARA